MKNKVRYYVSRKNPLTWLMALCMVASAVVRILYACQKGTGGSGYLWGQVVLPAAACLLFALICLFKGREIYYKTAIPGFMMALYFCIYTASAYPEMGTWGLFLYYFLYATLATVYAIAVGGGIRHFWVMVLLYLVPICMRVLGAEQFGVNYVWASVRGLLPDCLLLAGLFFGILATGIQNDGKYHRTWGDRPDGRRVRTLHPISQVTPYILVNRNTADNLFSDAFELADTERYIRKKRREGLTNFGLTHVILAAYARVVAKYPEMNRFISGQKIYSRGDDLQVCMTIKKEMTLEAPDSVIKLHLKPTDTSNEVYEKFNKLVEEVKNMPLNSDFDNTARILTLIPGVFLKFVVWLLRTMDYFGLLPAFLLEISPFHGSMFITSMGSLGIPAIYHHLYDFGNLPAFVAFGRKRHANEIDDEGKVIQRKYMDMKFTLDERIADGFTYAQVLKYLKRLIVHPEILDQPPEVVKQDID